MHLNAQRTHGNLETISPSCNLCAPGTVVSRMVRQEKKVCSPLSQNSSEVYESDELDMVCNIDTLVQDSKESFVQLNFASNFAWPKSRL